MSAHSIATGPATSTAENLFADVATIGEASIRATDTAAIGRGMFILLVRENTVSASKPIQNTPTNPTNPSARNGSMNQTEIISELDG